MKKFGLTIDSLCDANIDEVDECINNMMSHQQKAYNIIHIARRCRDEFGGDVPKTKAEMITLPGWSLASQLELAAESVSKIGPNLETNDSVLSCSSRRWH